MTVLLAFFDTHSAIGWPTTYEAIKYWLPVTTAFTLIVKAYSSAKKGVGMWAHKLLANHLQHIQNNTEKSCVLLGQIVDFQKKAQNSIENVAIDLKDHVKSDDEIQGRILTGIEILKDRI